MLLLLYWPAYLLSFILIERLCPAPVYHTVWCKLDDLIPFCEWFIFPYMSWHVSLLWMSLYTLAYDLGAFRRFMWNLILTTAIAVATYVIWPNQQLLRRLHYLCWMDPEPVLHPLQVHSSSRLQAIQPGI